MTRPTPLRPFLFAAVAALLAAGCANYTWTSAVPQDRRTVSVPVFENRTASAELGAIVTRHVRREFQREGTFALRRTGDAAVEVQGAVVRASRHAAAFDRGYGSRAREYRYRVTAEVSFIDKVSGKVLQSNRPYAAETTFLVHGDLLTAQKDAADRAAHELARQIVDELTAYTFNGAH